ncbi:MAG: magnesium/cobalt transporter CorA [Proteobacteria bacterium]|nr:magnesium/cobalt transporter CorA [Pseudomonadota bacterium]
MQASPARLVKRLRGRVVRRRRAGPGAPPGTLIADPTAARPVITVIGYGPDEIVERANPEPAELSSLIGRWPVLWVNVDGLGDVEAIRRVGETFGLHPLALEDVVNVHQRPKVEEYADHLYLVARMPRMGSALETEQVSLFLGRGFVLTFQERVGDCFDPVRQRLRAGRGRSRSAGPDYLAYALLDAIVDSFFPILERYGERVEELEDAVLAEPEIQVMADIHDAKRDLLLLRRAIWPQRDAISTLIRDDSPHVTRETRVFLRDCYDHTVQLIDVVETYREIASGLVEIYLSSLSARLNEVMKVLTVIATVFIPLSVIASIYGMNFDREASPWNMPELGWYWGYPFALGLMAAVGGGLLLHFWRKGWVGRRRRRRRP